MKNKPSLKKLFQSNKFVFAFSLLSAIVIWFAITIMQAPHTEKSIGEVAINIPIEGSAANQLGLDLIEDENMTTSVSVIVKGPNYVVSSLTAQDVSVSASLSNVNAPGKFSLELKASKLSQGEFEIVGTNPSNILATFDYIDTKKFTLIPEAEGAAAIAGLVAENAVVSDSNYQIITVKGPRTEILKIDKIVAKAAVNKTLSATESFLAELSLLDTSGNNLDKAMFKITAVDESEVNTVRISVPISKVKEVPLTLSYKNLPVGLNAASFKTSLSFNSVSIIGPAKMIDSISSIALQEIDVFKLSNTNTKLELEPVLPDGVKLVDKISTVEVTFTELPNYQVRTFTVSNFESSGGKSGTLKASIKNVKICAPRSVMRKISATDLVASADLTGKSVGDHNIEVTIKCKESNNAWQVGTYSATITIK